MTAIHSADTWDTWDRADSPGTPGTPAGPEEFRDDGHAQCGAIDVAGDPGWHCIGSSMSPASSAQAIEELSLGSEHSSHSLSRPAAEW